MSARFPHDFDDIERVITAATPFGLCPQCLRPNEREERIYIVSFPRTKRVLLRIPFTVNEDEVEAMLAGLLGSARDDWTVAVHRDVREFREAVGFAALAPVRLDTLGEITGEAPAVGGSPALAPCGERDRDYHAALALIGRPSVLVFTSLADGTNEDEARAKLDEARRFQLAIGFFESFATTQLAGFNPLAAIHEHFVSECFDDDRVRLLIASIIDTGGFQGDVVVLDAALGAAARGRSPRQSHLAEELVDRARAGAELLDDPSMWRALVDSEDVLRALLQQPVGSEAEVREVTRIASALGCGEEVLRRFRDRQRIGDVPDPGKLLDAAFAVGEERRSSGQVLGEALAIVVESAAIQDAHRTFDALLERLGTDQWVLAVPSARTFAKRLTDEGDPRGALDLLDRFEASIVEPIPNPARATLLNERGNAIRAMLDADGALRVYEEALLYVEPGADELVIRLNVARAMRDAGHLPQSIVAFQVVLRELEGRYRFDALFGLALAYQRNGQWHAAQPVLDEASELVRREPANDQIVRLVLARLGNARAMGRSEEWPLIDAIQKSPFVSARQKLLTLGAASVAALRLGHEKRLCDTTLELARGMDLPGLAETDGEFAVMWADAARLAGDAALARKTLALALTRLHEPILGIHAATVGAGLAVDAGDWADVTGLVDKAAAFMVEFVARASVGATTVTVSDTLVGFSSLASRIVATPSVEHDRLLSKVADMGASLQLSVQITSKQLPVGGDLRAPPGMRLQVLQWVDAGNVQMPLLIAMDESGVRVWRGEVLPTELASGLGARIAGRVSRALALEGQNVLDGLAPYREFRSRLATTLSKLPLDIDQPLIVAASPPMLGIPLHTALPEYDIAYAPSLTVAVALAHRASAATRDADIVAEVRCWCHGDDPRLISDLVDGGEACAKPAGVAEIPIHAQPGTRPRRVAFQRSFSSLRGSSSAAMA